MTFTPYQSGSNPAADRLIEELRNDRQKKVNAMETAYGYLSLVETDDHRVNSARGILAVSMTAESVMSGIQLAKEYGADKHK